MKKYLLSLLMILSLISQAQTYQNPSYGTISTKTNIESTTASKINAQEADGKINWLQPVNIPIPFTPSNYSPFTSTLGAHLGAIDVRLGQIGNTTAGLTTRIWFTGVDTTISAGTFFTSSATGKGAVASGTPLQSVTNNDDEKKYFTKDIISIAQPSPTTAPPGIYTGQLSVQIDANNAQQRYTIEIYKTNNGGTPIASGITGAPTGSLGVTVVAILDSGLINLVPGNVSNISLSGNLTSTLSLNTGERIRYHVSAEKVGTAGGDIVMQVFYGSNYNSYYDITVPQTTDGVLNKSLVSGLTASDAINSLYNLTDFPETAYVQTTGNNSTAQLGNIKRPFLTIDAALDALPSTGGVIKIGLGNFDSPTLAKIKNGTFFIGSGKPKTNSVTTYVDQFTKPTVTAPTMLVNGTILKGTFDFSNKNSIVITDLGIDSGSAWVAAHGGTVLNGLITGQVGGIPNNVGPPQKGIVVNNVSALCASPSAAVHAILIENTLDARISNISTYYGTHGFVIKSRGANAFNIDCHGHAGEGMIIKADTYAYCSNVNVDNVYITSIGNFDGGGLMIDGGSGTLNNVNINNVNIEHTTYGITDTATLIQDVSIQNVSIYKTYGNGVYFNPLSKNIILNNIKQDGTQSGNGIELNSTGTNIKTISNSTAKNCSFNGILLAGGNGRITASNMTSDNSAVVITGNVFGENIQGTGTMTGSPTLITGAIGAKTIALGLGASNTVGSGSAVILDNGLTAGSYRAISSQMNASNGVTYWKYNGSAWVDTGIRINETGTMSAQPGVNSNDVVVMSQLVSGTSGTYTPTITSGSNLTSSTLKSATYIKSGNIVTVTISLGLFATSLNTLTNFTATIPINRTSSTITDYYVGDGTYYVNNIFSPGHVVFVSNNLSTVTFTFNSGGSVGSSATCVIKFQYDITK